MSLKVAATHNSKQSILLLKLFRMAFNSQHLELIFLILCCFLHVFSISNVLYLFFFAKHLMGLLNK